MTANSPTTSWRYRNARERKLIGFEKAHENLHFQRASGRGDQPRLRNPFIGEYPAAL